MAGPYDNLNSDFAQRLQALINASNGLIKPGSGYRTYAEQAALYDDYIHGRNNQARAARPGTSKHNHGLAMDLDYGDNPAAEQFAHENAARFGLYFPMDDEPWHVQMIDGPNPEGIGGQTGGPGSVQYDLNFTDPEANLSPEEIQANRIQAIMSVLDLDPVSGSEGTAVQPVYDPANDVLDESQMFTAPTAEPLDPIEAGARMDQAPQAPDQMDMYYQTALGDAGLPKGAGANPADPNGYGQMARSMFDQYGWSDQDYLALVALWNEESGSGDSRTDKVFWNPHADNPTSTAGGIAQKLTSMHGPLEPTPQGQIAWGLNYIAERYGSPRAALAFHHKNNWY